MADHFQASIDIPHMTKEKTERSQHVTDWTWKR